MRKTTACRLYAQKLGLTMHLSATGKDPFSHFCKQSALISNALRSDTVSSEELLKILDPYYNAPIHSRYHHKVLQCNRIFIIPVEHPREFVSRCRPSVNDSAEQFYHRMCNTYKEVFSIGSATA